MPPYSPRPASSLAVVTDIELRIVRACRVTAELTGYAAQDLRGQHLGLLVKEEDRVVVLREGLLAALDHPRPVSLALALSDGTHADLHSEVRMSTHHNQPVLLWLMKPRQDARPGLAEAEMNVSEPPQW